MNWWIVGAGAGLAVVGVAAWWWSTRPAPTKRGMKQFARDRGARRRMARWFKDRDALLARAPSMDDAEIQGLVESLFSADPSARRALVQVLEKIGPRAEAPLMRALNDPRCDERAESKGWDDKTAFEMITELLAELGSEAILPRTVGLVRNGTRDQRKHAALCVASVGTDAAVEPTLAALGDEEEYVRSYAMMGAKRSAAAGRGTPEFRSAVFEALSRFVSGESPFSAFNDREAPEAMIALDRPRALHLLASPQCLRAQSPFLNNVLKALNQAGAPIDRAILLDLLARAKATDKYPWEYVREECLRMLVRVDPELASAEIEEALRTGSEDIKTSAAEVLREKEGLGDASRLSYGLDLQSLPRPVANVLAAWRFQSEVDNGGLSQYFFNPSGDNWPLAIEAFEALGAGSYAEMLRAAAAFFGPVGPSTNRSKRMKQYAAVSDEREKYLDSLRRTAHPGEGPLEVLVTRYMIRHSEVFREAIRRHVKPKEGDE